MSKKLVVAARFPQIPPGGHSTKMLVLLIMGQLLRQCNCTLSSHEVPKGTKIGRVGPKESKKIGGGCLISTNSYWWSLKKDGQSIDYGSLSIALLWYPKYP